MKRKNARRFVRLRSAARAYPAISDYALIGDCHTAAQYQADMYGLLVEFAWQWSELGHRPTDAYWKYCRSAFCSWCRS